MGNPLYIDILIKEPILQDNILFFGKSGKPFSFNSNKYFSLLIFLLRYKVVLLLSSLDWDWTSSSSSFSSSLSSTSSCVPSSSVALFPPFLSFLSLSSSSILFLIILFLFK